ncbi:phosphate-starvation-inducible PsiE family protein, partial [Gammaproteobacteria bacterium]|nr:phosphate-starvation-inducible PsiE family protein [Gammaproteobacteria bacterium]
LSERSILMIIAIATLYATGIEIYRLIIEQVVTLSDLFLLFIYAEVLGMVGSFYASNRLPVTLPIIIAMTALTRMIILQSKELDSLNIIYEASGILILAGAAYIMTLLEVSVTDQIILVLNHLSLSLLMVFTDLKLKVRYLIYQWLKESRF